MDYFEVQIQLDPKEPWSDLLSVELAAIGFETFLETAKGMNAYIPAESFSKEMFDRQMKLYEGSLSYSVHITRIKGENWNAVWEKNFEPISVREELLVRAPFHPSGGNKFRQEIVIEPKMSFGTGHHDTTWLMLSEMLGMSFTGKEVLDLGCGTGILAILAMKMGAGKVIAIDIDDWSVENARENIVTNQVPGIIVEKGGEDRLAGRTFHVILANINRNVLVSQMKLYSECLVNNGDLLLSGFFDTDADGLIAEASRYHLHSIQRNNRNGWCLLHLQKTL